MTTTHNHNVAPRDLCPAGRVQDGWFLVDVRTPAEFREASIAGSTNLPLGDLKRWAHELAARAGDKPVALVCRTGRRAQEAREKLASQALDLHVLEGGTVAWDRQGLPLQREPGASAMSIERQVRIAAGALTLASVGLGLFVHTSFLGLAAFVGAGQVFAGLSDTCGMGLLLAKMPWNRATSCALAVEQSET